MAVSEEQGPAKKGYGSFTHTLTLTLTGNGNDEISILGDECKSIFYIMFLTYPLFTILQLK